MARRDLSEEAYQRLVEVFREFPGSLRRVAREAHVDWRTAQKAWEKGWPHIPGRERPLKEVIAEEQTWARARVKELEGEVARRAAEAAARDRIEKERAAKSDAANSRAQEAQMIRLARAGTGGLFAGLVTVTKAVPKVSVRVQQGLEQLAASKEPLTLGEMLNMTQLLGQLTSTLRALSETGQKVMQMERLLLGEPTAILGLERREVSFEEAQARLEAGRRALEYAKSEGVLVDVTPSPRALSPVGAPATAGSTGDSSQTEGSTGDSF